jgi:dihydroorotate dehydrogenase electron transfer subunit
VLADHRCRITDHIPCGNGLMLMTLETQGTSFTCIPGQFVMFDLPTHQFFFRRPFSVLDVLENHCFQLYYKISGQGTEMMSKLSIGSEVNVLGPLGVGFPTDTPEISKKTLLIGGGIGIVPLYFWAKQSLKDSFMVPNSLTSDPLTRLSKPHQDISCFYGVRSASEIGLKQELESLFASQKLYISTDDGSFGEPGNVMSALQRQNDLVRNAEQAFVCGPMRMMEAVKTYLKSVSPQMNVYVSLEEHMPCGTGSCTGCVVERTDGKLPSKSCIDGPVFLSDLIHWPSDDKTLEALTCRIS